jgi:hypothetical protein
LKSISSTGFLFALLIGITVRFAMAWELERSEYPKPGAKSSSFSEGPHVLYEDKTAIILSAVEENGKMALRTSRQSKSDLKTVRVTKLGYLPRSFEVALRADVEIPATQYPPADKIFAVSDIEGNFNTLINLLQQHAVINDDLNWSFGTGHFVLVGDVFDRGNHVTEMLWLIYRLEAQAQQAGGQVHFVIGNHDAMNLRGDLRYVEPKYFDFAKLSSEQQGVDYAMLFGVNSELGRWLRTKNVIEKIGDKLFVHAGISPDISDAGYTLEAINEHARSSMNTPKSAFTGSDSLLWGTMGPFWYRGYFDVNRESWGPKASQADVESILNHYDATQIIVGHTHVAKPVLLYGGKVCAIDVKQPADHLTTVPPWPAYGILIQGSRVFIADENGDLEALEYWP